MSHPYYIIFLISDLFSKEVSFSLNRKKYYVTLHKRTHQFRLMNIYPCLVPEQFKVSFPMLRVDRSAEIKNILAAMLLFKLLNWIQNSMHINNLKEIYFLYLSHCQSSDIQELELTDTPLTGLMKIFQVMSLWKVAWNRFLRNKKSTLKADFMKINSFISLFTSTLFWMSRDLSKLFIIFCF